MDYWVSSTFVKKIRSFRLSISVAPHGFEVLHDKRKYFLVNSKFTSMKFIVLAALSYLSQTDSTALQSNDHYHLIL